MSDPDLDEKVDAATERLDAVRPLAVAFFEGVAAATEDGTEWAAPPSIHHVGEQALDRYGAAFAAVEPLVRAHRPERADELDRVDAELRARLRAEERAEPPEAALSTVLEGLDRERDLVVSVADRAEE